MRHRNNFVNVNRYARCFVGVRFRVDRGFRFDTERRDLLGFRRFPGASSASGLRNFANVR